MEKEELIKNRDRSIEKLQSAICAENTTSSYYRRLASLISNGRIRKQFFSFADEAKNNEELLRGHLVGLGVSYFPHKKCKFCKLDPESFSLSGAINLGLEVARLARKSYQSLLTLSMATQDKQLFKKLLKEKMKHQDFLKKEKRFVRQDESNFIDPYCIPDVISKLWE